MGRCLNCGRYFYLDIHRRFCDQDCYDQWYYENVILLNEKEDDEEGDDG